MLPLQGGAASIPGRGTKIPHASRRGQKKKKKKFKTTTKISSVHRTLLHTVGILKISNMWFPPWRHLHFSRGDKISAEPLFPEAFIRVEWFLAAWEYINAWKAQEWSPRSHKVLSKPRNPETCWMWTSVPGGLPFSWDLVNQLGQLTPGSLNVFSSYPNKLLHWFSHKPKRAT